MNGMKHRPTEDRVVPDRSYRMVVVAWGYLIFEIRLLEQHVDHGVKRVILGDRRKRMRLYEEFKNLLRFFACQSKSEYSEGWRFLLVGYCLVPK
jgi:hypothetical protein